MRKRIVFIILIGALWISTIPVSAHAGGSVGGGSGSSSGGSSASPNNDTETHPPAKAGSQILSLLPYLLVCGAFTYAGAYVMHKKHREGHQLMKQLEKLDPIWNEEAMNHYVTDTFYAVQYAWMEMDIEKLKEYLTPRLIEQWTAKLAWMEQREEVSVMKDIHLKGRQIMGVYDYLDDDRDFVWYYIKASMIDYNQNIRTMEVTEGDAEHSITFEEYWKFQRVGSRFLLDDVMGIDEVAAEAFRSMSESVTNEDS
ncbi:TIM44-like domain-containing protein [Clostridiaceae bacterium DONG20-135]|uniref:TIM44-like domain-containing protein n=1 Tax=Copranaerobaculum intestinale TaxID=2692629 RepID=A0A6N8U282_9FIRM|nr:Tim44-like domain-containing protein [Copranaerobaculum intestinale]MXQ72378.1 TIM44-like domain-containing protein [Copranaerobaculum intestinale]